MRTINTGHGRVLTKIGMIRDMAGVLLLLSIALADHARFSETAAIVGTCLALLHVGWSLTVIARSA